MNNYIANRNGRRENIQRIRNSDNANHVIVLMYRLYDDAGYVINHYLRAVSRRDLVVIEASEIPI